MQLKYLAVAAVLSVCTGVAQAASDSIFSDKDNECAAWLCLPGGWASSACNASHRAWIRRITQLDCDEDGCTPIYTPLPRFDLCVVTDKTESTINKNYNASTNLIKETAANIGKAESMYQNTDHRGAEMTYKVIYKVVVPEHNYPCTKWKCSGGHTSSSSGSCVNRKCRAATRVPERIYYTEDGRRVDYQHIEIGGREYETRPAYMYASTGVKADGKDYAEKWEELVYPKSAVNLDGDVGTEAAMDKTGMAQSTQTGKDAYLSHSGFSDEFKSQQEQSINDNYNDRVNELEQIDKQLEISIDMSTDEIKEQINKYIKD